MCLGIPGQVMSVDGTRAVVRIRGHDVLADASMTPVSHGEFVLVYAGLIVQVLDADEAQERLRILADVESGAPVT